MTAQMQQKESGSVMHVMHTGSPQRFMKLFVAGHGRNRDRSICNWVANRKTRRIDAMRRQRPNTADAMSLESSDRLKH